MADGSLFPDAALAVLRLAQWNPEAVCTYDGLSGGLMWDDEFPHQAISACIQVDSWAFNLVWAYRASLIRGQPREELRAAWDQLARECPQWPGFRPERRSADLRDRLEEENARFLTEVEALFDQPNDAEPVLAPDPPRDAGS